MPDKKLKKRQECQELSLDYGSYGYPCHLEKGHKGPHEVLDKDDCPHHWGAQAMSDTMSEERLETARTIALIHRGDPAGLIIDDLLAERERLRSTPAQPDLLTALGGIINIGKRDMSNPKYDGYFDSAKQALASAQQTADNYVAWLRWAGASDDPQRHLVICDSDAEGAFRVYRCSAPAQPDCTCKCGHVHPGGGRIPCGCSICSCPAQPEQPCPDHPGEICYCNCEDEQGDVERARAVAEQFFPSTTYGSNSTCAENCKLAILSYAASVTAELREQVAQLTDQLDKVTPTRNAARELIQSEWKALIQKENNMSEVTQTIRLPDRDHISHYPATNATLPFLPSEFYVWLAEHDRELQAQVAQLQAAFQLIKFRCGGEMAPNWSNPLEVKSSRRYILDWCDVSLTSTLSSSEWLAQHDADLRAQVADWQHTSAGWENMNEKLLAQLATFRDAMRPFAKARPFAEIDMIAERKVARKWMDDTAPLVKKWLERKLRAAKAEALREAADAMNSDRPKHLVASPWADWLRGRAKELEKSNQGGSNDVTRG